MAIRDRLLDLERHLKRLAGEPAPREPLEIRQALLERIVDLTQPVGRGRRVLPFDGLDVDVLAETEDARRVLEAVLERDEGLEAAVLAALSAAGCAPKAGFAVRVRYRRKAPAGWAGDQRFAVAGRATPGAEPVEATAPRAAGAAAGPPPAILLKVVKGRGARKALQLSADRVNLGRGAEVLDRDQRLVRRNQLAFVEGEAASDTVSRAHAHIRCLPSGECRLRDDGSAHGTRIVRAGATIDVAAGNTRGVRLQPGDEIHLGRAVVRFALAEDAGPAE